MTDSRKTSAFRGMQAKRRSAEPQLMMARYYSPAGTFRFMSVDPGDDIEREDPQSWNKYAYVRNNPLGLIDPSGMCGQTDPNQPGMCKINPDPDGDGKANITFKNDVQGAPSPDQFVTKATAEMVEKAVVASGVDSVNINSTTGGAGTTRGPNSRHGTGQAVDINEVNGKSVDASKSNAAPRQEVAAVQDAFAKQPNIRENYGPTRNEKTTQPGGPAKPVNPKSALGQKLIQAHTNHIHVSGQK